VGAVHEYKHRKKAFHQCCNCVTRSSNWKKHTVP
jgi:hypothetical protein